MEFFDRRFLGLFVLTTLFLLAFSGLYICYEFYLLPYFNNNQYEWFAFGQNGKIPSKFDFIFSGFKSPVNYIYCSIASLVFCFLAKTLTHTYFKNRWLNTFLICFSWTVLLSGTYFVYQLILNKFTNNYIIQFNLQQIRNQLPLLFISYFILSIPFVGIFYKSFTRHQAVKPSV